ncbi:MAG TPA: glycosyltransferase family 25 protein [Chlamydiales bacterium]|nr:glycosyltransferase family 25 protein [Chlamydiales bacterium]
MNWFLFTFFASSCLFGDLEDHFKQVPDKSGDHSMQNIDFIYMINLDQRPEKFKASLDQLAPFHIHPCRFPAVNGWEMSLEAIQDVGVCFSEEMEGGFMATRYPLEAGGKERHEIIEQLGQTYFVHCLPRGAIGCSLSHLSILQDALDSGYETIWIMEDDIEVRRDPRVLSELVEKLDGIVGREGWDVLFTDRDFKTAQGHYAPAYGAAKRPDYAFFQYANDYSMKVDIGPDFRRIANRYGTTSMIVRQSGMKKLLQFFKAHHIYLPYDMDLIYARGIRLFTVSDDVVGNLSHALSDVGCPHYLNKQQQLPDRS